jgi:hypothetical protein
MMAGVLKVDEADIRRDARPILMAAASSEATGKAEVVKVIETGDQRLNEATREKLEEIKLKELFFDGLPLEITLQYLMEESVKKDPEKKGFKMVARGNVPFIPAPDRRPVLNASGLPEIPPDAHENSFDRPLGKILILVNPPKKNLNFKQVIEAVCEGSLWPLTYQIEDGVIVFTAKLMAKLDVIKLKKTTLNRMPLDEVVRFLNVESRNQDVAKLGVDFSVEGKFSLGSIGEINLGVVVIDSELPEGASLRQALDAICAGAENPIQYEEKNGGVVFQAKAIAAPAKPPEPVAGSQRIFNVVQPKLNSIVIPKLQFKGMALSNALEILQRESNLADLEGDGLEIAMEEKMKQALWFKPMFVTIDPPLMNLTLREAIGAVTTAARHGTQAGVTYRTTDKGVMVELLPEQAGWQRVYRMDMARWIGELERVAASKLQPPWDSPAPKTTEQRNEQAQTLRDMVKRQLQEGKVVFSADEKGQHVPSFFINDRSGFVLVKGDLAQLEQVEDLFRPFLLTRPGEQAPGTSPAVRTNLPPLNKAQYGEALEELLKVRLKGAELQRRRNEQYFPAVDLVRTRASGVQVKKLEDFVPLKEVATNVLVEVHLAKIPQERLGEFGFQLALAPMDGSTRMTTMPEGLFKRIRENLEKGGPFMQLSKTNFTLPTNGRGWVTGYDGEDYAIVPKAYDDGETVELFVLKARTDDTGRPRGLTSSGFQRLNTSQTKAVMFPQSSGTFEVIYVTAYTTDKQGKKVLANPQGLQKTDPFMLQGSMGAKLRQEIGRIGFANKPLSEVISLLSTEVNRGRKADEQIYFFLNDKVTGKDGLVAKPGLEDLRITIDPPMENNSIEAVLKAISGSTSREVGKGLKHVVTSAGVMWMWNDVNPIAPVFAPASVEANAKTVPTMFTIVFKFDPEAFVRGAEKLTGKKASDLTNIRTTEAELVQTMARLLFASEGANMDASTEAGAQVQLSFMDRTGDFFVRAAMADREIILKAVEKARAAGKMEAKTPGKEPVQSQNGKTRDEVNLPTPSPYVQTNTIRGKMPLRNVILAKLDQIVLKEVFFNDVPLTEVMRFLYEESVRQDPAKKGVRFIINSNLDDQLGSGGRTNSAVVDLEKAMIKINPPLKNLRMVDALDAITKVATPIDGVGLSFMVEDYAVVFRQRVIDPPQLFTRIFKVDKDKLIQGLEKQAGVKMMPLVTNLTAVGTSNFPPSSAATNQGVQVTGYTVARSREFAHLAQQFFAACGVNMSANGPGQASTQIFFNDRTSVLMVRASLADLEIIAQALEAIGALVENVPIPSGISSAGSSVVRFYKFEAAAYVRGLERVTGKKVAEMSAADLAAQVNGGRGTTNKLHVQWHQIELLTREFLMAQGADLSTGNFGLTYPQNAEDTQEVRWNVGGPAMNEEVFRRSSQKIVEAGKLEGVVLPLGRATNQVAIKLAQTNQTNGLMPTPEEIKRVLSQTDNVSKLVQEAKQLYELRRLEEAEVKLREAMKLDPASSAAYYYMNLVQEARYSDLARMRDNIVFPGGLPKSRDAFPTPNPYFRTNVARTLTKAQQRIESKLDQVVIKEVFFDGLPLAEVVRFLREESAKQDPEKVGINFVINSKLDDQPGGEGGKTLRDPLGAPLAPVVPPEDLRVVLVTINPPLKNLTMREMLSAITNATVHVGKHGLDYKVEDFGVTFRQRVIDPPQLFTRMFKVDPRSFSEGLQKVWASSGMPANSSTNLQDLWREFIRHAGVKADMNSMATNQIFYNDKTGILMVRASLQDLEVIQLAIELLNIVQAQVLVEARYIEVSDVVAKKMGLNWFTSGPLSSTNSLKAAQLMNPTIPKGANVKLEAPVLPNYVSVLSPKQTDDLVKKLLSGPGVDILTAPRVTTVSGRQAQISVLSDMPIAVGLKDEHKNKSEITEEDLVMSKAVTGPSLDVIPKVTADGYALELTWAISLTQFVGYDKPAKGREQDGPLPRFRVRQVANTSALRDGQTLLIGCGTSEVKKEQKPGLFRGGPKTETKHVIVMLTPRIIDPTGKPLNNDKELGFE